MSQALSQSWHVGRTAAVCAGCNVALEPGQLCWAALCERRHVEAVPPPEPAPEAREDKRKSKAKDAREEPQAVSPFERVDFCEACWAAGKRPGPGRGIREDLDMFSFWRTAVPQPQQKKKLLVDDSVLVDLFSRMSERNDPAEERFRFVLALILMRKRLLKYDSSTQKGEGDHKKEIWTMFLRNNAAAGVTATETPILVINPHLTADQISEVSQQLSSVLAEEI